MRIIQLIRLRQLKCSCLSNFHHQPGETEKVSKAVVYTRDKKRQSQSEMWGSALTDHSVKENHVINWESARIVEKERDVWHEASKKQYTSGSYQT